MALPTRRVDLTVMAEAAVPARAPAWARRTAAFGGVAAAPVGKVAAPARVTLWWRKLRRVVRLPCCAARMLLSRLDGIKCRKWIAHLPMVRVSGRACNMAEEIGAAIPFLAAEHSGYTSDSVAVVDGPGAILLN